MSVFFAGFSPVWLRKSSGRTGPDTKSLPGATSDSKDFKITIQSFFLSCTDFYNNFIYFSIAPWRSTIIQKKNWSYNWMRGVRPNRKGTNPFSEPWDYDKTNIFVSGLDGVPEGSIFMRKIFRDRSCWKFTIDVARTPECILKF